MTRKYRIVVIGGGGGYNIGNWNDGGGVYDVLNLEKVGLVMWSLTNCEIDSQRISEITIIGALFGTLEWLMQWTLILVTEDKYSLKRDHFY